MASLSSLQITASSSSPLSGIVITNTIDRTPATGSTVRRRTRIENPYSIPPDTICKISREATIRLLNGLNSDDAPILTEEHIKEIQSLNSRIKRQAFSRSDIAFSIIASCVGALPCLFINSDTTPLDAFAITGSIGIVNNLIATWASSKDRLAMGDTQIDRQGYYEECRNHATNISKNILTAYACDVLAIEHLTKNGFPYKDIALLEPNFFDEDTVNKDKCVIFNNQFLELAKKINKDNVAGLMGPITDLNVPHTMASRIIEPILAATAIIAQIPHRGESYEHLEAHLEATLQERIKLLSKIISEKKRAKERRASITETSRPNIVAESSNRSSLGTLPLELNSVLTDGLSDPYADRKENVTSESPKGPISQESSQRPQPPVSRLNRRGSGSPIINSTTPSTSDLMPTSLNTLPPAVSDTNISSSETTTTSLSSTSAQHTRRLRSSSRRTTPPTNVLGEGTTSSTTASSSLLRSLQPRRTASPAKAFQNVVRSTTQDPSNRTARAYSSSPSTSPDSGAVSSRSLASEPANSNP